MAKAPAFQFYSADWFIDTAQMSRSAKGLHIDLLAIQWSNKFIEADEKGNPVGLSADDLALWDTIRHKYTLSDGKLINQKLEERRAAHENFRGRQAKNGEKGGRPKTQTKAKLNPDETQTKPTQNPNKSQKKPLEDEVEDIEEEINDGGLGEENENPYLLPAMMQTWKKHKPAYPENRTKDLPALQSIAEFICKTKNIPYNPRDGNCMSAILAEWGKWGVFIAKHNFFKSYGLYQVDNHSQNIFQALQDGQQSAKQGNGSNHGKSAGAIKLAQQLRADIESFNAGGKGPVSP